MNRICVFILFSFALSLAQANDCVNELQKSLLSQENSSIVSFKDSYACSEGKGCAVTYEVDNHPYPNSIVMAYMDAEKKFNVPWIIKHNDSLWVGWASSGKYLCADVKTYARVSNIQNDSFDMGVTKRTAYDMMFCPAKKVYFDYLVSCSKI